MAYIWILGDSWGDEWGTMTAPNQSPDKGFAYQFEMQGHTVVNLSRAGQSNQFTLNIAMSALERGAQSPTHIIQFWTEPLRSLNPNQVTQKKWTLDPLIKSLTTKDLAFAKKVKTLAKDPHWAIIGGQAPITKDDADRLGCSFHIENWRNEILGKDFSFAASNVVGIYDVFEWLPGNKDELPYKNNLLTEVKHITEDMFESDNFCDNCHPSWNCYEELSVKLLSWIRRTSRPTFSNRQKKQPRKLKNLRG